MTSKSVTRIQRGVVAASFLAGITVPLHAAEGPFRLNDALGLDQGFQVGLIHRSRFENLVDNVRPGSSRSDQVLVQRTLLDLRYSVNSFSAQLELADIRQQLTDHDSYVNTSDVNTMDILQANVGYRFGQQSNTWVRFGRFSEDWGSRRLIGRNRFRSTINAWDGLVVHHNTEAGNEYRLMATQVVRRLPSDRESLLDNQHESDESSKAQRFYAAFASLPDLVPGFSTELFFYALREQDTGDVDTRNRRIDTVGFHLRSPTRPREFDFEVETAFQTGKQRASSSPADTLDLDHRAFFQYLAVGYLFDVPSNLRAVLEFDYASGDEDPFDRDSGRFDSLFGPTTFEFGVYGLYDPFNRSNLMTPGLRVTADITPDLDFMASYRHFWLAEDKDSWGRTGLRDVTGSSGDYLGQHLELRLRWDVLPGNVRIEGGGILLDAKNLSDKNTEYFYTAVTFTF